MTQQACSHCKGNVTWKSPQSTQGKKEHILYITWHPIKAKETSCCAMWDINVPIIKRILVLHYILDSLASMSDSKQYNLFFKPLISLIDQNLKWAHTMTENSFMYHLGLDHFISIFIHDEPRGNLNRYSLSFKMAHSSVAQQHIYCVKFPYYIHTVDRLCHELSIMKSGMHGEVALFIPNTNFSKLLQINAENDVFLQRS